VRVQHAFGTTGERQKQQSAIDIRNGRLRRVVRSNAEHQDIDDLTSIELGTRFIADPFGDGVGWREFNPFRGFGKFTYSVGVARACGRCRPDDGQAFDRPYSE
jgi:hypothetical protein